MSKLTSARSGVPRAKPGALGSEPGRSNIIHAATLIFLEHGASAAFKFLGGSLRARILLPQVLARAKFIARRAKRFAEAQGVTEDELAQEAA